MSKQKDAATVSAPGEMSLLEACNESEKFGQMIRSLGRLQDVARALRNAEQVIAERIVARETVDGQIVAAQTELAAVKDAVAAAKTKAKEILERAQAKSDEIDLTIATRTQEAEAAAQLAAEELVTGARSQLATLQAQIEEAAQSRVLKVAELTTLQDQLAAVNEALAGARKLTQTLGNAK